MRASTFITLLWSRRSLFLVTAAVAVAAAGAVDALWPRDYVASARMLLEGATGPRGVPAEARSGGVEAVIELPTEVDIVRSRRVSLAAAGPLAASHPGLARQIHERSYGGRGAVEEALAAWLQDAVQVRPSPGSAVIEIRVRAADPRFAADAANAIARAYGTVRPALRADARSQTTTPGAAAVLLDPAFVPIEPVSPRQALMLALALGLAPLFGTIAVTIAGFVDRRALDARDLEQALGSPVLSVVPRCRALRDPTVRPDAAQAGAARS